MGLDMYLKRKIYIGANYEHNHIKGNINLTRGEDNTPIKIDLNKVTYIEEKVAYWRKANQIHNWFVQNIQDGHDDCGEYYVSKDKLKELVEICKKIVNNSTLIDGEIINGQSLKNGEWQNNIELGKFIEDSSLAKELLPTSSGFFFGGTQYDEYYLDDLQDTITMLEPYIKEDTTGDFYYSSSW